MVHHRRYFRAIDRGITLFYDASILCGLAHALLIQAMQLPDTEWEPFLRYAFAYFNLSCIMCMRAQSLAVEVPRHVTYRRSGLKSLLPCFGGAANFDNVMKISVTNLKLFAHFFHGTEPIRLSSHKGVVSPTLTGFQFEGEWQIFPNGMRFGVVCILALLHVACVKCVL